MQRSLALGASVLALGAGPILAQTADHAPTKPAADAAARYDRSLQQSAPANATEGSRDSPSGASTGTDPSATGNKSAPIGGKSDPPNAKSK